MDSPDIREVQINHAEPKEVERHFVSDAKRVSGDATQQSAIVALKAISRGGELVGRSRDQRRPLAVPVLEFAAAADPRMLEMIRSVKVVPERGMPRTRTGVASSLPMALLSAKNSPVERAISASIRCSNSFRSKRQRRYRIRLAASSAASRLHSL
jgi:hypothetical protein